MFSNRFYHPRRGHAVRVTRSGDFSPKMFWAIFRQITEAWLFLLQNYDFGIFWNFLGTLSGSSARCAGALLLYVACESISNWRTSSLVSLPWPSIFVKYLRNFPAHFRLLASCACLFDVSFRQEKWHLSPNKSGSRTIFNVFSGMAMFISYFFHLENLKSRAPRGAKHQS